MHPFRNITKFDKKMCIKFDEVNGEITQYME